MKNPLSLEAFADWLGTMPADKEYDWVYAGHCAIGQYLRSIGFPEKDIPKKSARLGHDPGIGRAALGGGGMTFGAAHQRARELLAKQNTAFPASHRGV